MKKILLSAILCSTLFASNSIAQLPDKCAPDFTTVDINGNTQIFMTTWIKVTL